MVPAKMTATLYKFARRYQHLRETGIWFHVGGGGGESASFLHGDELDAYVDRLLEDEKRRLTRGLKSVK
jgi:hypothetical protein